ncbi:MAG: dockerin type I repeat-containing protein [Ruminococcus sp.]
MNKLTALLLAGVMAACCVPGVSAAQTQEEPVAVDKSTGYRLVTTLNVKQGTMLFYPYNLSSGTTASFRMENETKNTSQTIAFKDFYNHPKTISISSSDTYKPLMGCGSGLGGGGTYTYENTGGRYDVIKVKVSDFISELNKDGSSTRYINVLGKNVTYKFTEQFESNGDKFYSALFFESGAAVTCVTPDKNGEAEIVVSRNPDHRLAYSTSFSFVSTGGLTSGSGGGKNRGSVKGLRMGDVDLDGYTDIEDVTYLQRILSESEKAGTLTRRNGDIDRDGELTINDATVIQQYLAEYDISQFYK